MKIAQVDVFPTRLPYRQEFHIARGSVGSPEEGAPHVYVRVLSDDGSAGWGEARPSHRWSYETEETVVTTLRRYLIPAVMGCDPWDLAEIHLRMEREIAPGNTIGQPIAKSALDIALHDLIAQAAGVPLRALFGGLQRREIHLVRIISTPQPAEAERLAAEAHREGYAGIKVKIGLKPERDVEIIRAVLAGAGPGMFLWADANQAYQTTEALRLAQSLQAMQVDVLEQPLPANDLLGLADLRQRTGVRLAVDESVLSAADLLQVIRLRAADWLVVKVSKCGGLRWARRCVEIAQEAGLGVLGSGLTESGIGLSASLHLLAGCNVPTPADFNGPQFLAEDPTRTEITLTAGRALLSDAPGHGASLDLQRAERYRSPNP